MKNILSYRPGTLFTGKEIREWIIFHTTNKTSHTKQALHMIRYRDTIKDERRYEVLSKQMDPHGSITYYYSPRYPQIIGEHFFTRKIKNKIIK